MTDTPKQGKFEHRLSEAAINNLPWSIQLELQRAYDHIERLESLNDKAVAMAEYYSDPIFSVRNMKPSPAKEFLATAKEIENG